MTLPEHEYAAAERKRRDDEIWNSAIEAVAASAKSIMNGRVYFNQRARRDDQDFLDAIVAQKRTTP